MTKRGLLTLGAVALVFACGSRAEEIAPLSLTHLEGTESLTVEIWADNWFALFAGNELVAEDSVPFDTERSFNAERLTFKATLPLQLNLVVRDFLENDTGLEYIGSKRQQMGDGGVIFQVRDADGETLAVSSASTRCLVVHRAPLDKSCEKSADPVAACKAEIREEPAGWKAADFDDGSWSAAIVHSVAAVRPKDGYNQIEWDATAQLIWSEDLETDNTLLCRLTVNR